MPNTVNSYIETDLGNVSPNPRGEYNAKYDYEYLDLTYYKGGSYLCLAPLGETIKNVPPIEGQTTTNWQCVAIPGDLTPEYISMYNEVVNDYNETNTNTADVAQMKDVTYASMTAAQESESKASTSEANARNSEVNAKQSMDKAKEYSDEAIRVNNDTQSLVTGFDEHVATAISNAEASISESTDNAKEEIVAQKSSSLNEFRTDAETVMTNEKNVAVTEIHQMVDDFSTDADSKKQEIIQVADEKINDMTALKNDTVNAKNAAETAATTAVEKASETATYAGEAKSSSNSAKANADLVSANKIEIDNAKRDVDSKVEQFESDLETYSVRTLRSDMTELQKETSDGFSALKGDLVRLADYGKNLVDAKSVTKGVYINRNVVTDGVTKSTEELKSNASWWTYEEYIPCKKGDIFSVSNSSAVFISGYQEDKSLCCANYENYNEYLAYVWNLNKAETFTIVNSKCKYIRISSSINADSFILNKGETLNTESFYGVKIQDDVIVPQAEEAKATAEEAKATAEEAKATASPFTYDYTQRGLYQFGKEMNWTGNYSVDADIMISKITVSALTGVYYLKRWTDGTSTGTCAFIDFSNGRFGFKKTKANDSNPSDDYVASDIPFNIVVNHEYYVEHAQIRGHLFLKIIDAFTLESAEIDAPRQMYGANWGARLDYASDDSITINYHKVYSLQPYNAHVLIVGDSFIEGYAPNSYASLMKSYFNGSVFINGYSGGSSSHVVKMMNYLPNLVQPKYVIIAIGTNENNYDTWLTNIQTILSKIETEMNGAIPIFATITLHTSYWNNDEFIQKANSWIRSSNYRYADLNKITTVNYDMVTQNLTMFREDTVHPTDETFEKMFERYKIDVPELFVIE